MTRTEALLTMANITQKEKSLLLETLQRMQEEGFSQAQAIRFANMLKDGVEDSNRINRFRSAFPQAEPCT